MAIFSGANEKSGQRTPTSTPAASAEGGLSIIAAGSTVTGDLASNGVARIEGRLDGTVRAGRQVLVGRQGEIKGDIDTREAVIGGRVTGTIVASERVEVQGTAVIVGDIRTKSIVVLEGGVINGTVKMQESVAPAAGPEQQQRPTPHGGTKAQPVAVVR